MDNTVEIRSLSKNFGKVQALDEIDMQIKSGEIHGFIGPNGAGKSTAIRILLGLLRADSGEAKIWGKDAWKDAVEIHENLAYVPGDANLWQNLTGGETIDLLTKMHGTKLNPKRKDELIRRFDLEPGKKTRSYSKGNKQKVLLIAAFLLDAELYVFDEPTSGLDPLMERVFQELVFEAKDAGKTVLLSSHILSEVERLCDSVSIIRKGKIIEHGSMSELKHLSGNNISVETRNPILETEDIEGILDFTDKGDNNYQIQINNDNLDGIINHISSFGLEKLEITTPTLEDLFMHHYDNVEGE